MSQKSMLNVSNIGLPSNINLSSSIKAAGGGNQLASYNQPSYTPPKNIQGYKAPTNTSTGTTTASTGGGYPGRGTSAPAVNQPSPIQPQGVSQADIDSAFNPVYGTINDLYNQANSNEQTYYNAATDPYETLRPDIENAFQQGQTLNTKQVSDEQTRAANAISQAKQLYNELSQGVQQRFGGADSASDFAKAFYGRQLQQNEGSIQNTSGQNLNSLATNLQNITTQHSNDINKLEAQKTAALSQAKSQFQDRLAQINQLKLATDQQKAQAKLDAIANLKATANSINQQFSQFQQQLVLYNQANLANLSNNISQYSTMANTPTSLMNIPGANYSQIGSQTGSAGNSYYTPVGSNTKYDQYGNPIG